MKIVSWNVNGIRAAERKGFIEFVEAESPDILCIQETKAHPDQLSEKLKNIAGYKTHFCSGEKKGYSGVAIYTKVEPQSIQVGLCNPKYDVEGRTLRMDFGDFVLDNSYYPNGRPPQAGKKGHRNWRFQYSA
jgi:exodeoxyribonuclease III